MTSRPSFIRQHALLKLLVFSGALWAVYRLAVFPPWQMFLHSDNIVPYIMTVEPWLPQDLFYWSAERFGALYSVVWKLIGHPLFGAATQPFFEVFFVCFFAGTAFWLATIRSWFFGFCFVVLMLPLMPERIDEFLYPGHVYGTLYLLIGAACWLMIDFRGVSPRRGRLLGFICALTYWQHLLAGLLMAGLVGLDYWYSRKPQQSLWRYSRPFLVVFLGCVGLIEYARSWAVRWAHGVYSHWETWEHLKENLRDFSTRGLTFQLGPVFGLTLLTILGLLTLAAAWNFVRGKGERFPKAFTLGLCLITLACIFVFNGHAHYTENLRHERYFSFLVPLVFLAIALLARFADQRWLKIFSYASMTVLTAVAVQRELFDRSGSILDAATLARQSQGWNEAVEIVAKLEASGCQGVLDNYWRAYRLPGFSGNQLAGSGVDNIRNPVYLNKVRAMANVCIADRYVGGHGEPILDHVKPVLATHDCKKIELDYWLCRLKAL